MGKLLIDFDGGRIFRFVKKYKTYKLVGCYCKDGYLCFKLNGNYIFNHRYLMEKYIGRKLNNDEFINHKNHVRDDNRICNLEIVSNQQNCQYRGNTLGYYWNRQKQKWQAQIMFNGECKYLGFYDKEENARYAYIQYATYLNEYFNCRYNV